MKSLQQQNSFRSSFINSIINLYYSAESIVKDSNDKIAFNKDNYKGQLLEENNQAEKQLCQSNLELIRSKIEELRDNELELLSRKKENELQHPFKDTLDNLTILKDIITEDELQIYADKCKDSELVQRRIKNIAKEKKLNVNTYPGFNEKMEAVKEIASAFIRYVQQGNLGLEAALYIKTNMSNYDELLD